MQFAKMYSSAVSRLSSDRGEGLTKEASKAKAPIIGVRYDGSMLTYFWKEGVDG